MGAEAMRGLAILAAILAIPLASPAMAQTAPGQDDRAANFVASDAPPAPTPQDQQLYGKPVAQTPDTQDVGWGWQDDHSVVLLGYDQRDRDKSPDPALDSGPSYPGQPSQDDSGVVGLSFTMHP
jgi:hypothetical protein